MSRTRILLCIVALGLMGTLAASAQEPPGLRDAMHSRDGAVEKGDAATWDKLTAARFSVVLEDGRLLSKADRMNELKSKKAPGPVPIHDEQVMQFGDTVVRRFKSGANWVLEVWASEGGSWQVVASQVTVAAKMKK